MKLLAETVVASHFKASPEVFRAAAKRLKIKPTFSNGRSTYYDLEAIDTEEMTTVLEKIRKAAWSRAQKARYAKAEAATESPRKVRTNTPLTARFDALDSRLDAIEKKLDHLLEVWTQEFNNVAHQAAN